MCSPKYKYGCQSHLALTLKCHQNLTGGVVGTKSSYAHQRILLCVVTASKKMTGPSKSGTSLQASKSAGIFTWGHEASSMIHFSEWKSTCCLEGHILQVKHLQRGNSNKRQWIRKYKWILGVAAAVCKVCLRQTSQRDSWCFPLPTNKIHLGGVCWIYQLSWWFVWYTSSKHIYLWYFLQNHHQTQHQTVAEHWILCDLYRLRRFTTSKPDFWTEKKAAEIV